MKKSMIVAACFALVACGAPHAPEAGDSIRAPGSFAGGSYSRITSEHFQYIEHEAGLMELWQRHTGGRTDHPRVDFSKDAVLALFAGQRPTGGYAIEVHNVRLHGDTLLAGIRILEPGAGCMTTQALTQPWQMVYAPRGAAAVEFEVEVRRTPCR